MSASTLGKLYRSGEIIVRKGEFGDCMFVIQQGEVEVLDERPDGSVVRLASMRDGEFFGEMALLEQQPRNATVRAVGEASILTLDKKTFLRRVHADPSLAYRLLQTLSKRIRGLNAEVIRLQTAALQVPPELLDPAALPQPPAPRARLGQ